MDPVFLPVNAPAQAALPAALRLPVVVTSANPQLDAALRQRLTPRGLLPHALGRLETLVLQLARIQSGTASAFDLLAFDSPQLLVFAADHGIADEGVSAFPQQATRERVLQMLRGETTANALADLHGFAVTLVDAGVATEIGAPSAARARAVLLMRKIGHGTRNMVLGPAMSQTQTIAALHAGMDVVRHLPGNVLALGDAGVAASSCAALLLSRLCGVPLADACGRDLAQGSGLDDGQQQRKLEKLCIVSSQQRRALTPLDALAALGGFDIAMLAGAMLQAASERRVVLVDGFVTGAAALVACRLRPALADYLVFGQRSVEPGHRLLLLHMQAQPLLDMELRVGLGTGALLAWPLLQAAQSLLENGG